MARFILLLAVAVTMIGLTAGRADAQDRQGNGQPAPRYQALKGYLSFRQVPPEPQPQNWVPRYPYYIPSPYGPVYYQTPPTSAYYGGPGWGYYGGPATANFSYGRRGFDPIYGGYWPAWR
jgi:hypothetical protein